MKMEHISKSFGGVKALKDVELTCRRGEVLVLAGENGAGKSTILKILLGIHQADNGTITFKGEPVRIKNPGHAGKLGIAMVFQELTLINELTVAENLMLGMEPTNCLGVITKREVKKRLREVMDRYQIQVDIHALVGDLPVAEQQMAEILKILLRDPDLIILDEPTSALAKKEVEKLYDIMKSLLKADKAVIFISHRLEEVFHIGDRVTVFKDGMFIGTEDLKQMNQDELIRMMVGRALESVFPEKIGPVEAQVIFEAKALCSRKLKQVSLQVRKGEILGIAGLQGHGQTELLNAISGMHPLVSGQMMLNGKTVNPKNAGQAIRKRIALVPSDRKAEGLMLNLSIRHNMALSSMEKRKNLLFIDARKEREFTGAMVKALSIKAASIEQEVSSLSGGNQQKVILGKELAIQPEIILFNEPTRGIDVEAKREFYQIMHQLASEGVAVIMCSSDLMEVIGMSDRVAVMYEGAVTAVLEKDDLSEESIMRAAMGLKSAERGTGA